MSPCKVLAVIGNHGCTPGVRALRAGLEPHVETLAVDSGSVLLPHERSCFDLCLPNVYYNGLLNLACAEAVARRADVLLFVCSDVTLPAPERVVSRLQAAFDRPDVALFAPAMNASDHRHMRRRTKHRLRRVSFVEGACFAVRVPLLATMCPVDLSINALGWGVDVQLGYLAWRQRHAALVDDAVLAVHRGVRGYDTRAAREQRDAFFARQEQAAQGFRYVTGMPIAKTTLGWRLVDPWLRRWLRC